MPVYSTDIDTIIAQATPVGRGGVGICRISGKKALKIGQQICQTQRCFEPRVAHFQRFYDQAGELVDEGLLLYFPAPHSFTGEDIVEFQCHGGQMVMEYVLTTGLAYGARLAHPGEFSQRAFLNEKIDLAQAEAIADLIDAASFQAVKSASQSLQGIFSQEINCLIEQLIKLRIYIEAAIDFPEEEIDFISDGRVNADLEAIIHQLNKVHSQANQGVLLKEGMRVVLAGKPNAGKSSLLNALAGINRAIVTEEAGTTRDILQEHIHIDGMPLHIIDTAGLRTTDNLVEQEGIKRAWQQIQQADRVLLLVDASESDAITTESIVTDCIENLLEAKIDTDKITIVRNKIDLLAETASHHQHNPPIISLSAKSSDGIDLLKQHLKTLMGFNATNETGFIARQRHLIALEKANNALQSGKQQLQEYGAPELLAEDLRLAQGALGEITGAFTADDLLGRIFSSFCIGK